ncbi:hypothetical protein AMECASPLE_017143 [Ameca splendens]|uniref:Uncharacterized protein n=1 Tax=Ameca splendens TaxID=208324 RepID=A0ABV0Y274_9TELE
MRSVMMEALTLCSDLSKCLKCYQVTHSHISPLISPMQWSCRPFSSSSFTWKISALMGDCSLSPPVHKHNVISISSTPDSLTAVSLRLMYAGVHKACREAVKMSGVASCVESDVSTATGAEDTHWTLVYRGVAGLVNNSKVPMFCGCKTSPYQNHFTSVLDSWYEVFVLISFV